MRRQDRLDRPRRPSRTRRATDWEPLEPRALLSTIATMSAGKFASGVPVPGQSGVPTVVVSPTLANVEGVDLAYLYADYLDRSSAPSAAAGPALPAAEAGLIAPAASTSQPVGFDPNASYTPSAGQPDASILHLVGNGVVVDATALDSGPSNSPSALASGIQSIGGWVTGQYGRKVSAVVPVADLGALGGLSALDFAAASFLPMSSAGKVDDQGVQALHTDVASAKYGVDGTGVTVGVLSDSFNNRGGYSADVSSGDLPSNVNVLSDYTGGGADEGRAMAQIVHDLAPGSPLAFNTAFLGEASFAQGITNLAKPVAQGGAGAKVITDDVFYTNEPMFQDGIIAQAINNASTQQGVTEFSAAGNFAHNAYQAPYAPVSVSTPSWAPAGTPGNFHNFNAAGATPDIYQPITIPNGSTFSITFQWAQPFASESAGAPGTAGSASDLDVYLVDATKSRVVANGINNNIGGDPIEQFSFNNTSGSNQFYLAINLYGGPAPSTMKYVLLGSGNPTNYATNTGASFGHSGATYAAGVAAAPWTSTSANGTGPGSPEGFSSGGGTAYLFDANGNLLATPDLRQQPRITAVDGTDTTFFAQADGSNGLFAFYGTSAAAPHAAAVAALIDQAVPSMTPNQVYSALQATALSLGPAGYNYDSGFGLIQADRALAAAEGIGISGTVYRDLNGNGAIDAGEPGVPGVTVFLDSNDNGAIDSGTASPFALSSAATIPAGVDGSPSRATSPESISGLTGRITKVTVNVNVGFDDLNALGLTLISPSGIRVPLLTTPGSTGANLSDTTFDDAAASSIQSQAAPASGTFRPVSPLSTLVGEDPNGTWQLEGRDFRTGHSGAIQSWSLTISYADPSAVTAADGTYSFPGLAPSAYYGAYHVRALLGGYSTTQPAATYDPTLAAGSAPVVPFGVLPTTVALTQVDDGNAQRSMVRKLVLVFAGNISASGIQPGAFAVTRAGGATPTFSVVVGAVTPLPGNQTSVELDFNGPGVVGGSLPDGRYTLTVDGSKITDVLGSQVDAKGTGVLGSAASSNFFRLFGDINGDATVDNVDLFAFRGAYNSSSGQARYVSYFDYFGTGLVNQDDLTQIRKRYQTSI